MVGKLITGDLDERLIEVVAKQVGGVRRFYSTNRAAAAMEGIVKIPFTPWIEKEEWPKDFNPPKMEKYEGKGDSMAHLLYLKQRMLMEKVSEALNYKLFATTLKGKALSWFCQLPEGSISNFATFGRKFLE